MWWRWFLAVFMSAALVEACGPRAAKAPPPSPTPIVAPSPSPPAMERPSSAPGRDSDAEIREYLARVFPPGPGRGELFLVCTVCHGIQVMVLSGQNKDGGAWGLTRRNHEVTLSPELGLGEEMEAVWRYLAEHFGSHRPPPPPLPQELIEGWQNYL